MERLVSVFVTHSLNQFLGKNSFQMAVFLLFFCIFFEESGLGKVRMHNSSEQHL